MRTQSRHPWLNVVEYPFVPREFETPDGWMSYVDHGRGRPLVFLHGSPSWSFVFRKLLLPLGQSYRCIAPDHLGFGLSDKPLRADYRLQAHAERFARLMDYLRLEDVTLVVHDAGGPIGLDWAIKNPDRVRDLVIFNTWMWPLRENGPAMRLARLVGNPINRFYYRALNASPTFIMPALFADRHRIPKATQVQYLEPFRAFRERQGIYGMVEALKTGEPMFNLLWMQREALAEKRALLLWGMRDPLFGPEALETWKGVLPHAEVVRFHGHGRFVPEEAPAVAADNIRWFLMNHCTASVI